MQVSLFSILLGLSQSHSAKSRCSDPENKTKCFAGNLLFPDKKEKADEDACEWRFEDGQDPWESGTCVKRTTEGHIMRKRDTIEILHFNDIYDVEKAPRFSHKLKKMRAERYKEKKDQYLTLFSGDCYSPSLAATEEKGAHMVEPLNALGINTAVFGNHEFDFGLTHLENLIKKQNFPWLLTNAYPTEKREDVWVKGSDKTRVVTWYGRRVLLLGLVEEGWFKDIKLKKGEVVGVFEDFVESAKSAIERAKAKEKEKGNVIDLVIALTHMLIENDTILAQSATRIGVDIILAGHDHDYGIYRTSSDKIVKISPEQDGNSQHEDHPVYIVKSGTDFKEFTTLTIHFDDSQSGGTKAYVKGIPKREQVPQPASNACHITTLSGDIAKAPEDKELRQKINHKLRDFNVRMKDPICKLTGLFDAQEKVLRHRWSIAGSLVAEAIHQSIAKRTTLIPDFTYIHAGTLRGNCQLGKMGGESTDITLGAVKTLLPFPDDVSVIRITGKQVIEFLENALKQSPEENSRIPMVSGIFFTFRSDKPDNQQKVDKLSVTIGNKPLDDEKRYTVVTTQYIGFKRKEEFDKVFTRDDVIIEKVGIPLPKLFENYLRSFTSITIKDNCSPFQGDCISGTKKENAKLDFDAKHGGGFSNGDDTADTNKFTESQSTTSWLGPDEWPWWQGLIWG